MQYESTTLRPRTPDLTDQPFDRLTVIRFAGYRLYKAYWTCQCICGTVKDILATNLHGRKTKSCGCLLSEKTITRNTIHGKRHTPEYPIWRSMLQRCENPSTENYHDYGGRGITVCPAWHDFTTFYKDMGPRPSSKHSIERLKNNEGYSPGNCLWATRQTQARNKRTNRLITYNNKTQCIAAWSEETSLSYATIICRFRRGWSIEKTLTTPNIYKR